MTDLVEAVAWALCEADCGCVTDNELARCRDLARAVIPVVLERAAKVADGYQPDDTGHRGDWGIGMVSGGKIAAEDIAAAIRGLGEP